MNFTRLNKEETIRKYISGELNSDEHIAVGDLIQTDPEWRLALERYQRSHQRHASEFGAEGSTTNPRPGAGQPRPKANAPTSIPRPEGTGDSWIAKFLKGWGIWIAIFLFFRFGSSVVGFFRDIKDRIQTNQGEEKQRTEQMIANDLAARYGKPDDELAPLIATCTEALKKAEDYYQDGRVQRYIDELLSIGLDESAPCRDEALYLAAAAAVDNGDADLTLNLVSQISDLDHFNADIQWLIAKAFVKNAKRGTTPADKAKRAVDRAMAFPENEKYKAEADVMLSELGSDI